MSTTTETIITDFSLSMFTGSLDFFQHSLMRRFVHSEGVQYVAEQGRAYWFVDLVASHVACGKLRGHIRAGDMVEIRLVENKTRNGGAKAQVIFTDPNTGESQKPVCLQRILQTDFCFDGLKNRTLRMFLSFDGLRYTLFLPSEY